MDLYEKNLQFIKENLGTVYNCIQSEKSQFDSHVSIIDPLNLKVEYNDKTCYIHSVYNTEREMMEMFSNINQNTEIIVIFGIGLWHCYNYLISNFKNLKHIIVIEPDLELFQSTLHYIDLPSLINRCNTSFLVNRNMDDIVDFLWEIFRVNPSVIMEFVFNLSYRSLYMNYYDYIYQGITQRIKNCLINTATAEFFLYLWAENTFRNLRHNAIPFTKLIGYFTGLPIIIVSAGPSLNYNMQYLKELKNKAVILAVGSAIKVMDSNGIVPHFRMSIDPQEGQNNIFNDIDTGSSPLIFSDRIYHSVLDQYKGAKIRMLVDTDFTGQYIYSKLYQEEFMIAGGFSVANVAFDAAIKLGFTKIILIGQDLCYTEGSLYAKGSWTDEKINENDNKYIKTMNNLGETVYTNSTYLGMKDIFENLIQSNPNRIYINATARGLDIRGTINKPIEKVIEEDLPETLNIDQLIKDILDQYQEDDLVWKQKLAELNLNIHIEELYALNELRLKHIKRLKKYFDRGIGTNKLQSELNYINDEFTFNIETNEFYKVAIKPLLLNKLFALKLKNQYEGPDENKIVESKINRLLGETTELKIYLDVLKDIISNLEEV